MSQYSYGDASIRESLWDQMKDLDAVETYLTSNSETERVTNKMHSWVNDPIANVTTQQGAVELAATSYAATVPTTLLNTTQIIEYGYKVSKTNQNSDHAGFEDKFAREQLKKMKEWKNQFELSAVAGSLASGTGTAARTMKGIVRFASTLATGQSGVSLTSDMLNAYLGNAWSAGANHEVLLVGRTIKERISSFTVGNTRNVDAADAVIVGRVDTYDSDHGRVTVVKHRYVDSATSNSYKVLVSYIPDYVRLGSLDDVHNEERPADGYYKAGAIVGEKTVIVANEKAVQYIQGLQ